MQRRPPSSTLFPYTTLSDLGAVLGELSRNGAARRRRAGGSRHQHGERLQDDGAATRARDHAEDQVGSAQLAVESERRRSEEHTSELQSRRDLVCRLLLEKKK